LQPDSHHHLDESGIDGADQQAGQDRRSEESWAERDVMRDPQGDYREREDEADEKPNPIIQIRRSSRTRLVRRGSQLR